MIDNAMWSTTHCGGAAGANDGSGGWPNAVASTPRNRRYGSSSGARRAAVRLAIDSAANKVRQAATVSHSAMPKPVR